LATGDCEAGLRISLCIENRDGVNEPNSPEGRPHGRAMSELGEIGNEETTVVSLLASNTNRSSVTTGRDGTLVVDFQDCDTIRLNICEVLGIIPRLVLDISMGGVISGEEGPTIEEVFALVFVLQLVAGIPDDVVAP